MLALSVLLLAFFFAPPEWCTLSGTVVDSVTGAPLNKVGLRAESAIRSGAFEGTGGPSTTTDATGNFTVNLPPGEYSLKAIRNGYLDTYYGARRVSTKGTTISLEAGQEMKNLLIKLPPFGVIAGTVRDPDGEPQSGAEVTLFKQHYIDSAQLPFTLYGFRSDHRMIESVNEMRTDDLGQYRFADLEPGKYFVRAQSKNEGMDYGFAAPIDHSVKSDDPPTGLLPTLYPGVTDPAAARMIEVSVGDHLTSIDISLVRARVFRVAGSVSIPPGSEIRMLSLLPGAGFESLFPYLSVGNIAPETGAFEFRGVPQGSFILRAENARVPLAIDRDIEGVRIAVSGKSEVTGHITIEGDDKTKLAGSFVHFYFATGGFHPPIREDNTFRADLHPDHYDVSLDLSTLVIKSIRSEQTDVFQDGLTVLPGGKTSLEIVLAPDGAQVDGVVSDQDEKPVAGATVVLIAEPKLRSRSDSYHASTTDQYGRYHFENIRPGDYKLFAWDDPEPNAWFDSEFLKPFDEKAQPIVIPAKAHAVSNLHILPAAQ